MAERKATNKYYPPDWDPTKGSANQYTNSHPLRQRARKIDDGILVIRFEMPFNVWCLKCDNHIGMGVRYNAEKSRVGSYYSTPIFKFRMKCHLCDNHFEIQTDPSKLDYTIVAGARKQVRLPESDTNDLEQIVVDDEEKKRRMTDAMFRLEKSIDDKAASEAQLPSLKELKDWRSSRQDSFADNQLVRAQFRKRRKHIEEGRDRDRKLLKRTSLNIALVRPNSLDRLQAREILKESSSLRADDLEHSKRREMLNSSLIKLNKVKLEPKSPGVGHNSAHSVRPSRSSDRKPPSYFKKSPG